MLFFPPHFAAASPPPFPGSQVQCELPELLLIEPGLWFLLNAIQSWLVSVYLDVRPRSLHSLHFPFTFFLAPLCTDPELGGKRWGSSWQSSMMRNRKHGGLGCIEQLGRSDLGAEIWSPGPFLSLATWALASYSRVYACHFLHLQVPRGSCKVKLRTTVTSPRASRVVWCLSLWLEYDTSLGSCIQTLPRSGHSFRKLTNF